MYYFNRRVPQDVRQAYLTQRISFSLKTKSPAQAYKAASHVTQKLEAHWLNVRLAKDQLGLGRYLKGPYKAKSGGSATVMDITFSDALEIYLSLKSRNKGDTFFKDTRRAVRYLIDSVGNKPLVEYERADASTLRTVLTDKGLAGSSIVRIFSTVKAIFSFVAVEKGLEAVNPFAGIYLDRQKDVSRRNPIPGKDIKNVVSKCLEIDDDLRCLVALISDTGMRLAEATGLAQKDIVLNDTSITSYKA